MKPDYRDHQTALGRVITIWVLPQLHSHFHGQATDVAPQIFNALIPAMDRVDLSRGQWPTNAFVRVCKGVADKEGLSGKLGAKAQIVASMTEALKDPCYFDVNRVAMALKVLSGEAKIANTPTFRILNALLITAQERNANYLGGFSLGVMVSGLKQTYRQDKPWNYPSPA
jgi:hypothetical protein